MIGMSENTLAFFFFYYICMDCSVVFLEIVVFMSVFLGGIRMP